MLPITMRCKSIMHKISYYSKMSTLMARQQNCARIVMFHGIEADSAETFAEQLIWLKQNFKVVPLEVMINDLTTCKKSKVTDYIALTFDDGLRNNFSVVYPILCNFKIPATFFVCPNLIGTDKWLWNHEIRCRLQSLPFSEQAILCAKLQAPSNSIAGVVEWMKTLESQIRHQVENSIQEATLEFQTTLEQHGKFDIMGWDELAVLDPGLITIGSHTMTHSILTSLSNDEVDFELQSSKKILEERLQRSIDFFCYPNGSYNENIYSAVKKVYRAAVTTDSGVLNRTKELDFHKLPRIPSADDVFLTAWRLFRPNA